MAYRIVFTGGPGGGKSTAAKLVARQWVHKSVIIPEAATMIFSSGFPRQEETVTYAQKSIFSLQKNLESAFTVLHPDKIHICDRGLLDGAAYWPYGVEHFYDEFQISYHDVLESYDTVIFMESAAVGAMEIHGDNPVRNESLEMAKIIDRKLLDIWKNHPKFFYVSHSQSFFQKLSAAMEILECL